LGVEVDEDVFGLSRQNLSILRLLLEIVHADYVTALRDLSLPAEELLITFIAPSWGNALSLSDGLDPRRTAPAVNAIVDFLVRRFPNLLVVAIQGSERNDPASLAELTARFDWSALRIYDFNPPGLNHGLLLATRGWRP
jgi:hypothetical protein